MAKEKKVINITEDKLGDEVYMEPTDAKDDSASTDPDFEEELEEESTPNALLEVCSEIKNRDVITITWNGVTIAIKNCMRLKDIMSFIDGAVDMCFVDKYEYHPELNVFAFRYYIVKTFTDLVLPISIDDSYLLLFESDLYKNITENIDCVMINYLYDTYRKAIDARSRKYLVTLSKIVDSVEDLVNIVSERSADISAKLDMESVSKMVNLLGAMDDIDEYKLADAFAKTFSK